MSTEVQSKPAEAAPAPPAAKNTTDEHIKKMKSGLVDKLKAYIKKKMPKKGKAHGLKTEEAAGEPEPEPPAPTEELTEAPAPAA